MAVEPEWKRDRIELIRRLKSELVEIAVARGYRKRSRLNFERPSPKGVVYRAGLGLQVFMEQVSLWPFVGFEFPAVTKLLEDADVAFPPVRRGVPWVHVAAHPTELFGDTGSCWKIRSPSEISGVADQWAAFLTAADGFFDWYGSVDDALAGWEAENPVFHNMAEYYYPALLMLNGKADAALIVAQRALTDRREDRGPRDPHAVRLGRFVDYMRKRALDNDQPCHS